MTILISLIITVTFGVLAYIYVSSGLHIVEANCVGDIITVTIKNGSGSQIDNVSVEAVQPDGRTSGSCVIGDMSAGGKGSCMINRPSGASIGTNKVSVTVSGAAVITGNVVCSATGV